MPVVRRCWPLLSLGLLGGCNSRSLLVLAPAPGEMALDTATVATTLFLVGDAGYASPTDRVLLEVGRQGVRAKRASAIVFLGDNVYPRGVPADTAATFETARDRLYTQAALSGATGLPVIFVPGNHDWDRQGEAGWASIQRQDLLLRRYADSTHQPVRLAPQAGCPGPEVLAVGPVRLVALDTPWWLHRHSRPGHAPSGMLQTMPDPTTQCSVETEAGVMSSLTKIHSFADRRITVTVGHHPLESHGEHGGHHPWLQYLFPFVPTPVAGWAWLPIGWLYPLGRKLIGHPQDLAGKRNQAMRAAIEGTFQPGSPFIYASGHDHSLEVIRRGTRYYLVSGAGTEDHQSAVGRGDSTAFRSPRPGFMRVDVLTTGRVRLGVTVLDLTGVPHETYSAWLKD